VTVGELLTKVTMTFAAAGIPTPAVDAEWLVRHVTRWSHTRLVLNADGEVAEHVLAALEPLVIRRAAREPLQLIVGSVGFRYLDIEVRPGVFIPRPETEVLAGEAVARVPSGGVVIEPCTGTGAIACAIAQESNAARVIATDISDAAVELAAANVKRADLPVTVVHGDLLEPVDGALKGHVDLLVSNPPYLTPDDLADSEPEVLDWDPIEALVAGPSGHEVTDRLIAAAREWLRPGGWLLLEVDAGRAVETARRAAVAGLLDAGVRHDLTGSDRIVVARRPTAA
jgi:release factor glutamine methyltransferase